MTIEQTRQLGIEFERRVQAMIPNEQFEAKLTTDTIYAYLNEFVQHYVKQLIIASTSDNITEEQRSLISEALKTFRKTVELDVIDQSNSEYDTSMWPAKYCYLNDKTYLSYISSISKYGDLSLYNKYISSADFDEIKTAPEYDKLRIIRKPLVSMIGTNFLGIIHDAYTNVSKVILTYYRKPKYFSLMTSTPCELPMSCFEDIIAGSILLYMQYLLGIQRQREEEGRRQRAEQRAADREAERKRKEQNKADREES